MAVSLQHKEGTALAITENGESRIIKLVLRDEYLEIFEKANPAKMETIEKLQKINIKKEKLEVESTFAASKLPIERIVEIDLSTHSTNSLQKPNIHNDQSGKNNELDGGLGISVKGGSDFNLPIIISRITPGGKADRTNRIFVGDAILELNGHSLLGYSHRDAVDALQASYFYPEVSTPVIQNHRDDENSTKCQTIPSKQKMILKLRYLPHAATVLLNEGIFKKKDEDSANTSSHSQSSSATPEKSVTFQSPVHNTNKESVNGNAITTRSGNNKPRQQSMGSTDQLNKLPTGEYSYLYEGLISQKSAPSSRAWVLGLKLPLQYAFLSVFEYQRHIQPQEKYNSFIVRSLDGNCTGIISFKDPNQFHFWKEAVKFNINGLLINSMNNINRTVPRDNQVHYLGWFFCLTREDRKPRCKHEISTSHFRVNSNDGVELRNKCVRYHECEYENIETMHSSALVAANRRVRRASDSLYEEPVISHRDEDKHLSSSLWCHVFKIPSSNQNNQQPGSFKHVQRRPLPHAPSSSSSLASSNLLNSSTTMVNRPLFLVIQGIYLLLFEKPPICLNDWLKPFAKSLISRSTINYVGPHYQSPLSTNSKDLLLSSNNKNDGHFPESLISSIHSYTNQNNINNQMASSISSSNTTSSTSYSSALPANTHSHDISPTRFLLQADTTIFQCVFDAATDYYEFETIWIRINFFAIRQMKVDSFPCMYQNVNCLLCLDFDYGIRLVSANDGTKIWQYQFHQMIASSDDEENRLRLIFTDSLSRNNRVDQILHCHNLDVVLITIKSFLTAKLGQVDPHYFDK